jgi:tetratricopeptide (TPR) repeat protein
LNNLAALYHGTDRYAEAEPLYREASEICRETFGEAHPHYAASLNNLAGIEHSLGHFDQAGALYRRALEIGERAHGEHHPSLALGWTNLAGLHAALGQRSDAHEALERAAAIQDYALEQVFSVSSEAQRLSFLATLQEHLAVYLTLASAPPGGNFSLVYGAWRLVLRRKAIVAESMGSQREAALSSGDPHVAELFRAWDNLRGQIARHILDGPGRLGPAAHREGLERLTGRKKELEEQLAQRVSGTILPAITNLAVAKALPADSALIEIVRHEVVDFAAVPSRGEARRKPSAYVAFVLLAGEPESLSMISLGEADAIDAMIARTAPLPMVPLNRRLSRRSVIPSASPPSTLSFLIFVVAPPC